MNHQAESYRGHQPWIAGFTAMLAIMLVVAVGGNGGAAPSVYIDDGYAGLPNGTSVDWPYTGSGGAYTIGENAFAFIQAGVDAVDAGGTVNVAAGTYNETITFAAVFAKDNITISGEAGAAADTVVSGGIYMAFSASRTGLRFRHLTLKGTCQPGQSFTLRADTEKGPPADTVFDSVIFDGENTITKAVRMLYVTGTLTFINSIFKNYGSDWALINVGSKSPNGYNLVFNNNTVKDCGGCAQFFNVSNVTATNNAVSRIATHPSTWDALGFDGRENPADRGAATVTGNTISDNNAGGLIVSRFVGATVSANTITGNASNSQNTGLSGFGLILENNTTVTADNNLISVPSNLSATVESTGLILEGDGAYTLSGNMINTVGDAAVSGIVRGVLIRDRTTGTALDLGDTSLAAALPEYIAVHTTASNALVNATAATFAGLAGSGMTLDQLYDTENKITHKVDDAGRGFVRVKADNVYVTSASGSIQRGIGAASTGDTVNVAAGTYREHLAVRKPGIRLAGQDKDKTILDAAQDPSWSVAKAGILICGTGNGVPGASNVTVTGFTIRNAERDTNGSPFAGEEYSVGPGGMAGIQIYGSSGNTIEGNVIDRCGFQVWIVAEWSAAGYGDCNSNRIMDNTIRNSIRHGIYLYSDDTVSIADTSIGSNCVSGVEANYSGIRFLSEGAGSVVRTLVENNTITSCYYGIRLNSLGNISGTAVRLNSIAGNINYGVYNGIGFELNATSNYWGAADGPGPVGPGSGDKISINVTYVPWYADAAMTILCYPVVGLAFTTQPGGAMAGSPFSPQPAVEVLNEIGGRALQYNGQVCIAIGANPSGGALSGVTNVAAVAGLATFSDLAIDRMGAGYTLIASAANLASATSTAFNVLPADGWLAIQVTPTGGTWQLTAPAGYTGPTAGTGNLAAVSAVTGAYGIAWGPMAGYVAPDNQTQFVIGGSTTLFAGVYTEAPAAANGWVAINVTPDSGAWRLTAPSGYTGPTAGTGDLAAVSAVTGQYAVSYGSLTGYEAPDNQAQFVTGNSTARFTGVYLQISTNIATPADISITEGAYTNKIRISWQAVAGAIGYEIWRSTINDANTAGRIADIPASQGARSQRSGIVNQPVPSAPGAKGSLVPLSQGDVAIYYYDDYSIEPLNTYYYWVRAKTETLISPLSYAGMGYAALAPDQSAGTADIGVSDLVFLPVNILCLANPGTVSCRVQNYGPDALSAAGVRFDIYMGNVWVGGDEALVTLGAGQETLLILNPAQRQCVAMCGNLSGVCVPEVKVRHLSTLNDPNLANNMVRGVGVVTVKRQGVNSPGRSVNDYDGDGRSDLALASVNMEALGVLYSGYRYQTQGSMALNAAGWLNAAGDYDGDGKTDVALYEPNLGVWCALLSSQGGQAVAIQLGCPGVVPVPTDYDGDGRTDPAIYWAAMSYWRGLMSKSGYATAQAWVGGEDFDPVMADYDGDNKADLMTYSATTGRWLGRMSGSNYELREGELGGPSYQVVSADYDGDGKVDPAVYTTLDGLWQVALSSNGQVFNGRLGGVGFDAVPADYDGDGKADPAVYEEATGIWSGALSSAGYQTFGQFGGPAYRPVSE